MYSPLFEALVVAEVFLASVKFTEEYAPSFGKLDSIVGVNEYESV